MIRDLGLDPQTVMRRAGLQPAMLDGDGTKISLADYARLLDVVTEEVANPALPLMMGDANAIDYFDPAFFAAMCSPDMNAAAVRIADYKQLVSPFRLNVEIGRDITTITFDCPAWPVLPQTQALTEIVFLVNFVRRATRHHVVPRTVTMPFDVPAREMFDAHFGCPVKRGAGGSFTLAAVDAQRAFVTHDDDMWSFFEAQIMRPAEEDTGPSSTRERVTHCLATLLPNGRATMTEVARELALSKRTLQRRLADEGTTWLEVLNAAREGLAKHYLLQTDLGTTEVSFLLGFEDPNSLFRAFKRWENTSPENWRAQNSAHAPQRP